MPVGSDWFTTIERATVLAGRMPDPNRDDEAVITSTLVPEGKALGLGVGSVLTWRNLSPADLEAVGDEPPDDFDWTTATGPVTRLRIVGVVRLPMESVVSFASSGLLLPGPAWAQAHLAVEEPPPPRRRRPGGSMPSCAFVTARPTCRRSRPAWLVCTAGTTSR